MAKITYYFATISPYAYLAGLRLEKLAQKHAFEIDYRPVDLMRVFAATGGVPPKERHISRQEIRVQELQRQSKKLGLHLNLKPAFFPTNMAPSSYAIICAARFGENGDLGALAHSFMRACWAEEKDVAAPDVIAHCLQNAGFDPAIADKDMGGAAEIYNKNTEDAIAAGVFGAPFYITEQDQRFWGQDRIEDLDLHLSGAL